MTIDDGVRSGFDDNIRSAFPIEICLVPRTWSAGCLPWPIRCAVLMSQRDGSRGLPAAAIPVIGHDVRDRPGPAYLEGCGSGGIVHNSSGVAIAVDPLFVIRGDRCADRAGGLCSGSLTALYRRRC